MWEARCQEPMMTGGARMTLGFGVHREMAMKRLLRVFLLALKSVLSSSSNGLAL